MLRPPKFATTYLKTGTPNQDELKSIGCNHIHRFVGFPSPRPLGLRIRVLHLSCHEYLTSQYTLTRYPTRTKRPRRPKGGRGGVGARSSSSSKNLQLPQQQQRASGETR